MGLFKRSGKKDEETVTAEQPGVELQHLTAEEFDQLILSSEAPVVVDFWAEWCGPCHAIAPSVQQLANEFDGRAVVAKLNADDYPEVLMRYGIMGIPTLIYFRGGEEVDRVVGFTGYSGLKNRLEKLTS